MNINDPPEKDISFDAKNFNLTLKGIVWKDNSCWFHSTLRFFLCNPVYREYLKDFYDKNKTNPNLKPFDGTDDISNNTNTALIPEADKEIGWKRFFMTLQYFMELQAPAYDADPNKVAERTQVVYRLRNAYARLTPPASGQYAKYKLDNTGNVPDAFGRIYNEFSRYCLNNNAIGVGTFMEKHYYNGGIQSGPAYQTRGAWPNYNSSGVSITSSDQDGYDFNISNKKNPNIITITGIEFQHPCSRNVNVKDGNGNIVRKNITADSPVSDIRTIYINGEEYRLVNFSQYRNENVHVIAYGYKDLNSNVLTKFDDLQGQNNNEESQFDGAYQVGYLQSAVYVKASLIGQNVHYNKNTDKFNLPDDANALDNYGLNNYNNLKNEANKLATDLEKQKIQTIRKLVPEILKNIAISQQAKETLKKTLNPFFLPDNNEEPIIKPAYSNEDEKNSNNIFALNDREKITKAQETIYNVLKQDPSYEENLKALTTKYEMNIQNQEYYKKFFDKPDFLDGINNDASMMFKLIQRYKLFPPKSLMNEHKIQKKDNKKNDAPNSIGDQVGKTPQQGDKNNQNTKNEGKTDGQQQHSLTQIDILQNIGKNIEKYTKQKEQNDKKKQDNKDDRPDGKKPPDKKIGFKDRKEEEELKQKANKQEEEYNDFLKKNKRPEISILLCILLFILVIFPMIIYIVSVKNEQKEYDKKQKELEDKMNEAKKAYEDKKQANKLKYQQPPAPKETKIVKQANKDEWMDDKQWPEHNLSSMSKKYQQTRL